MTSEMEAEARKKQYIRGILELANSLMESMGLIPDITDINLFLK